MRRKVVLALPGVPPIYLTVFAYVADKQGFFKKYNANVELRQFDSGAAGSRAVISGDIDLALVADGADHRPDRQCQCRCRQHLWTAQSRLGDRHDRCEQSRLQRHQRPAGRRGHASAALARSR